MRTEGVELHTHIGVDILVAKLRDDYDAVVLAGDMRRGQSLVIRGPSPVLPLGLFKLPHTAGWRSAHALA